MDTFKIARACAISGAITVAVALLVAPSYWWLGLLSGIASCYLAWEFRSALAAIPVAWVMAVSPPARVAYHLFLAGIGTIVAVGSSVLVLLLPILAVRGMEGMNSDHISSIGAAVFLFGMIGMIVGAMLKPFCCETDEEFLGVLRTFRRRWNPFMFWGYHLPRLFWAALRQIPEAVRVIGMSCWALFVLIHRSERVLSALDGTLGGVVVTAWTWWSGRPDALFAKIFLVVCGMAMGALFGVLNYEIVSRRILGIAPPRAV